MHPTTIDDSCVGDLTSQMLTPCQVDTAREAVEYRPHCQDLIGSRPLPRGRLGATSAASRENQQAIQWSPFISASYWLWQRRLGVCGSETPDPSGNYTVHLEGVRPFGSVQELAHVVSRRPPKAASLPPARHWLVTITRKATHEQK